MKNENLYAPPCSGSGTDKEAKSFSRWSKRKRSFFRGLLFGYLAHWMAFAGLIFVTWVVRPFIWPIVFGSPYTPKEDPMAPLSGEWLYIQAVVLIAFVFSGYVASAWSARGSWTSVTCLAVMEIAIVIASMKAEHTATMLSIWLSEIVAGLLLGALIQKYRENMI